jgi:ankyrin repeat protein
MHFFKTIKSKNWGKLLANFVVAGIFVAYFIQLYVYNNVFMSDLLYIQQSLPLLLNRFRYTMLSYAFMRERILNNNTLNSFNEDPIYGFNIDSLYIDKSMENEQRITDFKIRYQSIASTLADIQSVADSQSFCASLIGNFSAANNTINSYLDDLILTSASSASGTLPYQRELDNQVALQQAAISGNIPVLRSLKLKGTDMNGLNYDRRTALHFAVRNGQLDTVKYLVQIGASINLEDRWGATPLNYA